MKHNYCTLFDRNYLYKGLALYNSLLTHCPDFTIWILCMDDITFKVLSNLNLGKAVLIKHSDFENEELLKVKPERTVAEYCWTCTSSLPLYVLNMNPALEMITYLDADLFFYSAPAPIFEEMGDNSVMIIGHRFPDSLKYLEENGIYNVSLVAFRNDAYGLECLRWWKERCIEWCYYRLEDGKLGDQKYLDDWPTRFKGVHVLEHEGAGVALWNIMRYDIKKVGDKTFVNEVPLIFYHFHQFQLLSNKSYDFGARGIYSLTPENIRLIYEPYVAAIEESVKCVKQLDPEFDYGYEIIEEERPADKRVSIPQKIIYRLVNMFGRSG